MCPFFNKNIRLLLSSNYLVHGNKTYSFFSYEYFQCKAKKTTKLTTNCVHIRWSLLFLECFIFIDRSIHIQEKHIHKRKNIVHLERPKTIYNREK